MTIQTFDLTAVRKQFPALARADADGDPVVHADAPGGTQVLQSVITAMTRYLVTSNANQHGAFAASEATDALCARVRGQAAVFTGGQADGIVFGPNMTTLTWHFSRVLDRWIGSEGEIVCTRLDHDANVAPWLALAERTGATVRWVELDAVTGRLDLATLEEAVTRQTRLIAFPGASNALGTVVDPEPFVAAARTVGALTFMDAVHAAPHEALDRTGWGVDVLACSPYKFYGPHAGLLSADPGLLAELTPDKVRPASDTGPERWQTGTASFEAIAGVGAALEYLARIGLGTIAAHEATLTTRFLDGLAGLRCGGVRERTDGVRLYGPAGPENRTPTFAITVAGHDPDALARALASKRINTWAGHYYAIEPMRALGLIQSGAKAPDAGLDKGGAVRIGFAHYHGAGDVDRVLEALAEVT